MKIRLLLILALLFSMACATGGARHTATVTVVSAHAVLSAVQDTEKAMVCGQSDAPPAPACVTPEKHREISGHLVTAFDLDGQIAQLVRALPAGSTLPANVPNLLGQIAALVQKVLALIPNSTTKDALVQRIGA